MALTLGLCCYIEQCHKSVMNDVTDVTDGAADPESVPKIIKYTSNTWVCMEIRVWTSLKQHVCVCNPPPSVSSWSVEHCRTQRCLSSPPKDAAAAAPSSRPPSEGLNWGEIPWQSFFFLPVKPFCRHKTEDFHAPVELEEKEEEEEATSSSKLWWTPA